MTSHYNQSGVEILGWTEGDASQFVPRPRPTPPSAALSIAAEQAKARWLPALTRHMVPREGGRLAAREDEGCREVEVAVLQASADSPHGSGAWHTLRGAEVSLDVPGLLGLWHQELAIGRAPAPDERVQYVPWEAIATISFLIST